jgi:hypothetical protein
MITLTTAMNCTSTAIISHWGIDYFGVSRIQFLASQTVLLGTIAVTPMLLAPVSEAVSRLPKSYRRLTDAKMGRNSIYQVTSVMCVHSIKVIGADSQHGADVYPSGCA